MYLWLYTWRLPEGLHGIHLELYEIMKGRTEHPCLLYTTRCGSRAHRYVPCGDAPLRELHHERSYIRSIFGAPSNP